MEETLKPEQLKERLTAQQIKEKYAVTVSDETTYFASETTGTEGAKKTIFMKTNALTKVFELLFKHINYKGEKILATAPPNNVYSSSIYLGSQNLVTAFEVNDLVKYINNNKVKYIFSAPSFILNFKDHININKDQVLMLTGEVINATLHDYLKEKNINCYHFFGSSEYTIVGIKKFEDEYYQFISDDISIEDDKLYSPYVSAGFIKDDVFYEITNPCKLNDVCEVNGRKFKFVSRVDNFAKIHGHSVSIIEINKSLSENKKIVDFVVFKTNTPDELDRLALVYTGDISEQELKDYILNYFNNFHYAPEKIMKIDKFPNSLLGKKDMALIRQWIK
jgi:acyl-coenzyme A synthetase/AMP-(fatty) acid ligase